MPSAEDVLATLLVVWVLALAVTSALLGLVVAVQAARRVLVDGSRGPVVE